MKGRYIKKGFFAVPRIAVFVKIDLKSQKCRKICRRFLVRIVLIFFLVFFCFRFFLDIFASMEWKKFGSVESEYLKKLAAKLPDTLLYSKAESTMKTYATG